MNSNEIDNSSFSWPEKESPTPETRLIDGQISGLNPFLIFLIGIAYIVFFLYVLRCCWNRVRFGSWIVDTNTQRQNDNDEISVTTERMPSFLKVVVMPNQDLCYGMSNPKNDAHFSQQSKKQLEEEEGGGDLPDLFFKRNLYNKSFYDESGVLQKEEEEEEAENHRIRFFRTTSIDLRSDSLLSIDLENISNADSNAADFEKDTADIQNLSHASEIVAEQTDPSQHAHNQSTNILHVSFASKHDDNNYDVQEIVVAEPELDDGQYAQHVGHVQSAFQKLLDSTSVDCDKAAIIPVLGSMEEKDDSIQLNN